MKKLLYCKTLPASATTRSVRIAEVKTLTIQPIRKFKGCITEVKKALQVCHQFHPVVFEFLIVRLLFVIKVKFIRESRTSAAYYTHPKKLFLSKAGFLPQLRNFLLSLFTYVDHDSLGLVFLPFQNKLRHAILHAIVIDRRFDSVFSQYGTVDLHRRKV